MNDQLQQALTDLINKVMSGTEYTTDFLLSELPDVIYQILLWYGIRSFIFFIIGIILIIGIIYGNYLQIKLVRKYWDSHIVPKKLEMLFCLNTLQLILIPAFGFLIQIDWLKIWIAPKLWLIEYAASFAK